MECLTLCGQFYCPTQWSKGFGLGESDRLGKGPLKLPLFFGVWECRRRLLTTGRSPNQKCNKQFGPTKGIFFKYTIWYVFYLRMCLCICIYHLTLCKNIKIKTTFWLFKCYVGVQLINNVVLVSGVQHSDSVIHIHVSTFSNSFPIYVITEYWAEFPVYSRSSFIIYFKDISVNM